MTLAVHDDEVEEFESNLMALKNPGRLK